MSIGFFSFSIRINCPSMLFFFHKITGVSTPVIILFPAILLRFSFVFKNASTAISSPLLLSVPTIGAQFTRLDPNRFLQIVQTMIPQRGEV